MLNDAAAYQAYVQRVVAISPAFHDGPAVATAVRTGAAYEPGSLLRGRVGLRRPGGAARADLRGCRARGRSQRQRPAPADPTG